MKMSKRTRILSVLLCIAVMMGIMSVGMMANAANSEAPGVDWNLSSGELWGPNNLHQVYDDYVTVNGVGSSASDAQWTIGGWGGALGALGNFAGCDGVTFAVRIDSAGGNPSQLNANLKLFVGETCFQAGQAIPVGGGTVQVTLPFEGFAADGNAALLMTAEDAANISNFQFVINSYGVFWGNAITDAVYTVSDIYGYTGDPDPITLPGDEQEESTPAPTPAPTDAPTAAPTTTVAPTTEAPAPTTTVAPAPTTTAAVKAATPAKVKKVTAKSKAKKKVVVTWKAAKNAKKYVVKYSYKKNMKKAKTVTVKKAKATLKKLKSGKKVYIQVQGVNGSVKGKWSAKKAVKVK